MLKVESKREVTPSLATTYTINGVSPIFSSIGDTHKTLPSLIYMAVKVTSPNWQVMVSVGEKYGPDTRTGVPPKR